MKKNKKVFSACIVIFLFVFAAFMIWYIPSMSSMTAKVSETRQGLETSRGRENKQLDEYNKAVEELPLVKAELLEKTPLAEDAEQKVAELKAKRKELRQEKKALEEKIAENGNSKESEKNE